MLDSKGEISPTLSNLTLDGLEKAVHDAVPRRCRVNFVRYADDFIVTGKSKRLLEEQVKPAVEAFLTERGLSLSEEKTMITHITDGFTFLGQTFRKTRNVLHITPAKKGVLALKEKLSELIHKHVGGPLEPLVKKLNQTLRGWGNYHRHVVSSETFSLIDTFVYEQLWRMIKKRHRKKSKKWLKKRYWMHGKRRWIFTVKGKNKKGPCSYHVIHLSSLGVKRYIKIKADANPYDPEYSYYFWRRRNHKDSRILPSLSAREHRQKQAGWGKQPGCPTRTALINA